VSIEAFPVETLLNWEYIFEDLRNRGVEKVSLVASDSLPGIDTAIAKHFHSEHQLCVTHLKRNTQNYPTFRRFLVSKFLLYFTYLDYDYRIRAMIYTTNWIERLNRQFCRVTRMRAACPVLKAS
jgi:putative transposase